MSRRPWGAIASILVVLALGAVLLNAGEDGAVDLRQVHSWIGRPVGDFAGEVLGTEGGTIFPVWDAEERPATLGGFMILSRKKLDIKCVHEQEMKIFLDPDRLRIRSVVVSLQPAIELATIEEIVGTKADLRECLPAPTGSVAVDSPLELGDGRGDATIAVFVDEGVVAEMFESEGMVGAIRWLSKGGSTQGCP